MKITKIGIKNLNSLRLQMEIDFERSPLRNAGLFAIVGDTGAGKTTILDALTLGLYGRMPRNKDVREVLSHGATDCYAEVEFQAKDQRYRAKWTLWRARNKADGKLQGPKRELARWNADQAAFEIIAEKIKEVDEGIEEVSGLDYDRFCRSVLLSQGDFAAFLKANERERSDLLERITGTEIYSRLSKMAYTRFREEEEKLKMLQNKLEGVSLLSKEEKRNLKKDIKVLEEESKKLTKDLASVDRQLAWLNNIDGLEVRQKDLEAELEKTLQEKEVGKSDFETLELHQKAHPILPFVEQLEQMETQRKALSQDILDLQSTQPELEKTHAESNEKLLKATEELGNLRQELEEKTPLFDKVKELDSVIQNKAKRLASVAGQMEEIAAKRKEKEENLALLEGQKKNKEQQLEEYENWLKTHDFLARLKKDLPTFETILTQFEENEVELQKLSASLAKQEKEIAKKEKSLNKIQDRFEKTEEKIKALWEQFQGPLPSDLQSSGLTESLDLLQSEIDKLTEEHSKWKDFQVLALTYNNILANLDALTERSGALEVETLQLQKQMLNHLEALEVAQKKSKFRENIYEQQLKISNYEKDRTTLKEGQPCPLCFSEHHPFHEMDIKPYVDAARAEYDQALTSEKKLEQNYRKLLHEYSNLEVERSGIKGFGEFSKRDKIRELNQELAEQEERMSRVLKGLPPDNFAAIRKDRLSKEILSVEEKIKDKKALRKKLSALQKKFHQAEEEKRSLENILKDQRHEIAQSQKEWELGGKAEEKLKKASGKHKLAMEKILAKYPEVSREDPVKARNELVALNDEFDKKRELRKQTDEELVQIMLKIKEVRSWLDAKADQESSLKEEYASEEGEFKGVKKNRADLFGKNDPVKTRSGLESKIKEQDGQKSISEKQLNGVVIQIEKNATQLQEKQKQLQGINSNYSEARKSMETRLSNVNFASVGEVREAILPENTAQRILDRKDKLGKQEIEQTRLLQDTRKQLAEKLEKKITKKTKEDLQQEKTETEAQNDEVKDRRGALKGKLSHDEELRKDSAMLVKDIDKQRLEFNRWARLNDVIGAADGKKFRVFAQGLTLHRLTYLANQHLQNLNGRYLIRKRNDEELTLEIIDTFQADNTRSMNTLSGGESFLVSLALALGLSDLAGRNTSINSLFIDEGFGTLDEDSLDLAISTLENLQAKGKSIGVISHVLALKERISTQIRVSKKGGGVSEVKIVPHA